MVPAAFVCLSSLPLTPNGKLDRQALPAPDVEAFARQLYEEPRGEMEEKLAAIWSELLGIEQISRNDNFFALGGHSLLIVKMLSQLRQIELDTNVREVFDAPSLAVLAETLSHYTAIRTPPNLITVESTVITPEMLPLIDLSQTEIDVLVKQMPGGIANIQDIYGLASLQQGILFHHLMAEQGDPYLIMGNLQFNDRATLDNYAIALQQVIERHDILRTAFIWEGLSEPAQVVLRQVPSLLTDVMLDDTDDHVLDQLNCRFNPRHYRLDLKQAPLMRLLAAPTSKGDWIVLQLMHHIIGDHTTQERLNIEVKAIIDGQSEKLTTPTPFRHLVAQARLGVSQAEHTKFFEDMLADVDTPTLPFGLSDVHDDGTRIDEMHLKLPQELNNQLRAHARHLHVSLASLFHLAWAQVLAKASGHKTVVFGTVLFGRLHSGENDSTMGLLINTLPIRLDIDERTVESAVRHTHSRLSSLLAHEHASLALAQRCSGVSEQLSLFNALLNYRHKQPSMEVTTSIDGVTFLGAEGRTNYPITLSVDDDNEALYLTSQVFSPISASRICSYMQQALFTLADALTNAPEKPVQTLTVIPQEEREMLLYSWNETTVNYPPVCCLHQLFEAQVERDGRSIAVECEGETMNYAELNAQANQLAHYLIANGVKPDDRIALCVKRSTKMIIAILGILKAGAAYVPLDPAYSSQRINYMLHDANPLCVLTDSNGQKALGTHHVSEVNLDQPLPDGLLENSPDPVKFGLNSGHLAYVIYTSGSTGRPKGVMIEHQSLLNLVHSQISIYEITHRSRLLQFASCSFDTSILEISMALTSGACLCIPNDEDRQTDTFLTGYMNAEKITHALLPPALFQDTQNLSDLTNLEVLIFGGETPSLSLLQTASNHTKVYNGYGPTETTIAVTTWSFSDNFTFHSIPIGRPIANTQIYLLDSQGEPVPLGAEGELYIAGVGVARGYLNQPEHTAERFIPDPFSENTVARMYRTGDQARYLPDGNLVYMGRTDQQIKIRGFRIEPSEIEARLVEHPLVRKAVVQLWKNKPNTDAQLVAYVVADPVDPSLAQNLRTYLLSLLPDYMVPAAFVCLSSLPITPNGKLDRRALPTPDDEAFVRQLYEAPNGEMEVKLAAIWNELLGIERISRNDNFFALGGHSLLIVRMLAKLQKAGIDSSVKKIFDTPSLTALAKTLVKHQSFSIPANLINVDTTKITPDMLPLISLSQSEIDLLVAQVPGGISNIQDIYGLAPLQEGILFHHMMAERGDSYLLVSRLHFSDREALKRYAAALQQAIERHDIYRTAFIWEGLSEPAQIVLRRVPSILTEVTLDETNEPVLEQLNNRYNPRHYKLDLTQAPLLRVFAAQTSKGDWMAVILMHHLIDDNTTLKRLNAEIHAIIDGECDQLTTPTPFRHVVAQARFGVGQAEHTQFFEGILADVDTPTLPFGLSDVHGNGTSIDEMHLKLPHELSNQLREHARHLHVSLASLCHLAWAQVLAKASGHKIVVFGTVLFGRLHSGENESTMGLLINTLPIRLDIDERTVESAVRHTHSRLSALLEHEHASLALAQRCSGVPATLPLFNALLNYRHNQPSMEVSTSMHGVTFLGAEGRTNYPINLSVDDDSDALALTAQVLSPISAARICGYMQQALISLADALANTPEKSVRSLTVMTLEERKMLLHSWNQTTINYSPVRCIHELFEKQVERDGRAIAVECEGEALSYQELNKHSNQLAHYLIARGVRPDDCIAVCVKRSTKMLVALLGILKSGGAYVPLDPIYSSQRLTHILQDAKPLCLLADSTIPKALGVHHQVPIVDLDEPLPDVFSFKNTDPDKLGLTLAHLAYVIYTSGSTGIPKGVMVEHQSVINLGCAVSSLLGVTYTSRVMLFASCAFDASMGDIVMALTSGARLCLPNEETRQKDVSLLSYIRTKNISHSTITPALFAKTQNLADLRGMQTLSFGGETPSLSLLKNATIHTNVVNVYGPTETTITATTWQCPVDFLSYSIPIGRPLSNTQIYLLDAQGEPVPLGAEGELYIGGAGVARGYLNRPELTADRFLPDPFNEYPTARMYRTGDLARYLPDGNLVYLGRTDQQVKIRGFRIEPGEIEARLTEHPLVREAVVQPWKNGIDTRLIAYVVADPNASLANNLRTYLASLLPDYMVPAAYVCLSSLPLTPNCKLDKHALPSPEDEAFARQLYESPQGEVEEKVALIWSELLGIERISRNDNFFELGGHSLLVMRFTNLIKKLYDISVSPQAIFSFPILKDLSEKITNSYDNMYSDVAIPARRYGDQAPIFLLPSGDGNISYGFEFAHEIDKKVPVYVLPWSPPEKEQPSSIEEMANTMISLIKKVQPNGPCAVAGYSSGGILAYEIANQLTKSGYPVSFTGLIDTYPPCVSIPYNETEMFLTFIARKFPFFKSLNDTKWWERVLKLSLNEAIDEVKQKNVDLKNEDIDWEVLLLKQRIHYKTICELYNINPISTTVNLFKATEIGRSLIGNEYLDKCLQKYSNSALECFNCPKNGWEMYNLPNLHVTPINCNHTTIIADARNRNLLGRLVTQSLLSCDTCIN
ncbi:uncharacterized protein LOC116347466 [Contarinia nasturtii]|uniref:uncharacterized protein LOC116347466 n=1 Tax=Contarinia nasturtii TaxID=265458 RepID=UPI0012D4706A|nr:uncharacterized protein LOC116347466 [Contarinia nasturtii]